VLIDVDLSKGKLCRCMFANHFLFFRVLKYQCFVYQCGEHTAESMIDKEEWDSDEKRLKIPLEAQ